MEQFPDSPITPPVEQESVEPDAATIAALHFQDICRLNPDDKQAVDDAFRDLVSHTSPQLLSTLKSWGIKDDAALDIMQTTYMKTFKALSQGKFEGRSKFHTWIYRGLKNNQINYLVAKRRRQEREVHQEDLTNFDAVADTNIEEAAIAISAARAINDLLEQMKVSKEDKKIWAMRLEKMPYPEIAAILGITVAAARVRHHRLKNKLASRLES